MVDSPLSGNDWVVAMPGRGTGGLSLFSNKLLLELVRENLGGVTGRPFPWMESRFGTGGGGGSVCDFCGFP